MADIDWPSALRGAIQSTKVIESGAGFIESDPAAGASYTQHWTDDHPTVMGFNLAFTKAQAQYFEAWSRNNRIFSDGVFFNFPVWNEYGYSEQEVRFLSSGKPSYSENGVARSYSGCRILIPNYVQPDAEMVNSYYDIYGLNAMAEWAIIDNAVNVEYPAV